MLETFREFPHLLGKWLGYDRLLPEHDEFIIHGFLSKDDCTLMAHRGSYKTTVLTVVGTIWYLLFNPNTTILITSSNATLARKILLEIKSHYERKPLETLYGRLGIDEIKDLTHWRADSIKLTTKKKTTKEGNVEYAGADSKITGGHYDIIIGDDLVTIKDRYSAAEREKKKNFVRELKSIINPGGHRILVGTPWHEDDIYKKAPNIRKYPIGSIPIPEYDEKYVKQLKEEQGDSFFAAQYELNHIADIDRIFVDPKFENIDNRYNNYGYLDPAFKPKEGDFSSLTIGSRKANNYFIKYGNIWQETIDVTYDRVEKLYHQYNLSRLVIESNAAQRLIIHEMKKRGLNVEGINNSEPKHLRILNNAKKQWKNLVFDSNINNDYMSQILTYTEFAAHDDAPDSLSGLIKYFNRNPEIKINTRTVNKSKVLNLPT